ncbi:hypothetical protein KIPB_013703, partial [Kipferlia bialata]
FYAGASSCDCIQMVSEGTADYLIDDEVTLSIRLLEDGCTLSDGTEFTYDPSVWHKNSVSFGYTQHVAPVFTPDTSRELDNGTKTVPMRYTSMAAMVANLIALLIVVVFSGLWYWALIGEVRSKRSHSHRHGHRHSHRATV